MARPSNTAERRDQIASGLAEVLMERGFRGASVARIAEASGLSAGLVHYHFDSKRDILLHLVAQITEAWTARVQHHRSLADPPRARLHALLHATLATGPDAQLREAQLWTTLGTEAARSEDVREAVVPTLHALRDLLQHDLSEAGVSNAPVAAQGLLAAIEGTWRLAALGMVGEGEGAAPVHAVLDALLAEC